MSCFIVFKDVRFDSTLMKLNLLFAILLSIPLIIMPIFIPIFLIKNFDQLDDKSIKNKYESIYLEVVTTNKIAIMFSTFFLLRRMIFAISIMFISNLFC